MVAARVVSGVAWVVGSEGDPDCVRLSYFKILYFSSVVNTGVVN